MELKALRISEKKAEVLHSMQIMRAEDLLTCYPFRYEHLEAKPRDTWKKEDRIIFEAVILNRARVIRFRGKQSVTRFKVMLEDEELDVSLFNRPWVSAFTMGKVITIIGKYDGGSRVTALQYNFKPMKEQLGIHPVYNVREGITQKELVRYIDKAWQALQNQIPDVIPKPYLEKYRLIPRKQALYFIHHPASMEAVKQSLRHLKYEEFLKFQLSMQALKARDTEMVQGSAKQFSMEDVMDLKHSLSFTLTNDQNRVVEEILQDLSSDKVMYRMVQGDVGCGKTMVAAFGLYACVLAHKQAVFMAPTEILAKQHLTNLKRLFSDFDITVDVLYSSLKPAQKRMYWSA
ncbi:MAG: DEAD/DEAH box helicase [[Clostridium] innocuum]